MINLISLVEYSAFRQHIIIIICSLENVSSEIAHFSSPGDQPNTHQLLALASRLRDSAELFQSDEMRPANDPRERIPVRVRMLNDILQDMEKNFLVQQVPPGFYR